MMLRVPTDSEFQQICSYINEFELDNRNLQKQQFTVALSHSELLGFGRLLMHADGIELCSLGVLKQYRRKGIGKAIVKELIHRAGQNLYLVCTIPEFFTPFGFRIVPNFPSSIQKKIYYCIQELVVPEKYVAMVLQK